MKKPIFKLLAAAVFLAPLIILPLTVDYYHPPKEIFVQAVVILCLALWLMQGIRKEVFEITPSGTYPFLLAFCAIAGLSLIWAPSRYLALRDYSQILTCAAAFFICLNIASRQKEAAALAGFAFAAGVISAIYALLEYFGIDFITYPGVNFPDWRFRLYSTFGNPDFLANYLVMIFPVGIAFYLSAKNAARKILLLFSLAIVFYAILAAFSLGAILGLAAAAAFGLLLFTVESLRLKKLIEHRHIILDIAILIIALGIISVSFPSILHKAKSSLAWRSGIKNRAMAYKTAYRMVRDHPVLGVGVGNFKLRFPEYRGRRLAAQQRYFDPAVLDKQRHLHVHNDLIQIWAETGVFGLISFMLILLIIYKNGVFIYFALFEYKKKLFALGLLCSITAFLVHSVVSFPMHVLPCALLFWVFMALLEAQARKQEQIEVFLNISGAFKKIFFEILIIIITLFLYAWPINMYLSDIFLKRMVDLDRQGKIDKAFTEAKLSLFFNPDSNAVIYVGNCANLTKDYETAIRSFTAALKNNDEINYRVALAEAYHKSGLHRECISEYVKALRLNPCSGEIHIRLAELYADNNMYSEAMAECQILLMDESQDKAIKDRMTPVLHKIFEGKFLTAYYYGEVKTNK